MYCAFNMMDMMCHVCTKKKKMIAVLHSKHYIISDQAGNT